MKGIMMKILLFSFSLLLVACTDNSNLDRIIPASSLAGSTLETVHLDVESKNSNDKMVYAKAVIPLTTKQSQLKPTCLAMLKVLKQRFKKCDSITIFVSDEARMVERGSLLAIARMNGETIEIKGGIPTEEELVSFNKPDGNSEIDKMMREEPALRKPNDLDRKIVYAIDHERTDPAVSDGQSKKKVAKSFNLPLSRVKDAERAVFYYYGMHSNSLL